MDVRYIIFFGALLLITILRVFGGKSKRSNWKKRRAFILMALAVFLVVIGGLVYFSFLPHKDLNYQHTIFPELLEYRYDFLIPGLVDRPKTKETLNGKVKTIRQKVYRAWDSIGIIKTKNLPPRDTLIFFINHYAEFNRNGFMTLFEGGPFDRLTTKFKDNSIIEAITIGDNEDSDIEVHKYNSGYKNLVEKVLIRNDDTVSILKIKYDAKDRILQQNSYDRMRDNKIHPSYEDKFFYDNDQLSIIHQSYKYHYNMEGEPLTLKEKKLSSQDSSSYNKQGYLVSRYSKNYSFSGDTRSDTIFLEYESKNQITNYIMRSSGNHIKEGFLKYDKDNRLIERIESTNFGALNHSIELKYNDQGNLIEESTVESYLPQSKISYEYEHDQKDNWVEANVFFENGDILKVIRDITYYN